MPEHELLAIDRNKCTLCGTCVDSCPAGALAILEDKLTVVRSEACTFCGFCEEICQRGALALRYQIVWREIDG